MKLIWDKTSLWVRLEGDVFELTTVQATLADWCNSQHPVWVWDGADLLVMAGALMDTDLPLDWLRSSMCALAPQPRPVAVEKIVSRITDGMQACKGGKLRMRPYQAEAIRNALNAPCGRGLLDVAMGGGKTFIAAVLAYAAAQLHEPRWLYLVQNMGLAQQSEEEFAGVLEYLDDAGCGSRMPELTATTYSGIAKLPSRVFDGIIIDEVHTAPARSRALAYATVPAYRRIGMSGTALDRQDTKNSLVIGLTGPVVLQVTVKQLMDEGFLAPGVVQPICL